MPLDFANNQQVDIYNCNRKTIRLIGAKNNSLVITVNTAKAFYFEF